MGPSSDATKVVFKMPPVERKVDDPLSRIVRNAVYIEHHFGIPAEDYINEVNKTLGISTPITSIPPMRTGDTLTFSLDSDGKVINQRITFSATGGNMHTFSSGIDDAGILNGLDSFRNERDRSTRMGELLNDEAALLELEAAHKRAQAALIYRQLNEDVPVPVDVAQGPFDFTDKGKKTGK